MSHELDDDPVLAHINDGMIVKIGQRGFALNVPASTADCLDLLDLSQRVPRRAAAAALAMCAPTLQRRLKITPESVEYSWARFGGIVYDRLIENDAPRADVISAGTDALLLISQHMRAIEADRIARELGNSEPAPSTTS